MHSLVRLLYRERYVILHKIVKFIQNLVFRIFVCVFCVRRVHRLWVGDETDANGPTKWFFFSL